MRVDKLQALRKRLSAVNRRLLEDLNERLRLVSQARELKRERGIAFHDAAREAEMMRELLDANEGPATAGELRGVFKEIFAVSISHAQRSGKR